MQGEGTADVCPHMLDKGHWYDETSVVMEMDALPDRPMRYCAGPLRSRMIEPWRRQVEMQMAHQPPFFSGSLRPTSADHIEAYVAPVREQVAERMSAVQDSLKDFKPVGWFSTWGERWYVETPIYDALCAERGDPWALFTH